MKKSILYSTLVVSSFILFSFRGTTETKQDAEVFEVTKFSMPLKNFIEYKVYLDGTNRFTDGTGRFERWREDWLGVHSTANSPFGGISCKEMSETLEKY